MDLNGDGAGDLIVGAPQFADQDPGYIAIYFGSREEASRIRLKPHDPPIVIPRTLLSLSRTLAPGARFHRTFTQTIPGSASAGTYTVVGNAGTFPTTEASDRFNFEKL